MQSTPLTSSSPPRITATSSVMNSIIAPIALTAKDDMSSSSVTINPVKMPLKTTPTLSSLNGLHNVVPSTSTITSCQNMPLNLHATATLSTLHQTPPLNGLKNGLKTYK